MKILVVQIGRIGDMILTTPMFSAIKTKFPESELHVLTSPKGYPIIANNPYIAKIRLYNKGLLGLCNTIFALRKETFDVWIDPKDHGSREGSLLARYSRAKKKIGFNKNGNKVFDIAIPSDRDNFLLHAIERNFIALQSFDIQMQHDTRLELFVSAMTNKHVEKILDGRKRIIVVNISAGQPSRMWTDEGWATVIHHCIYKGYDVALTFQPSDLDRAKEIYKKFPALIIDNTPTIDSAIALIQHAALVVTVDTSIVHVASAFNTPIVALYPNVDWNFNKFKPLSKKQSVIISSSSNSILDISPETVLAKIDECIA